MAIPILLLLLHCFNKFAIFQSPAPICSNHKQMKEREKKKDSKSFSETLMSLAFAQDFYF